MSYSGPKVAELGDRRPDTFLRIVEISNGDERLTVLQEVMPPTSRENWHEDLTATETIGEFTLHRSGPHPEEQYCITFIPGRIVRQFILGPMVPVTKEDAPA